MVASKMYLSTLLLAIAGATEAIRLPSHHRTRPSEPSLSTRDLPGYVTSQRSRSVDGMLANIGATGSESSGASAGVVIASPSTVNPNYLYSWIRDGALTMKTLVDELILGNANLQTHIEEYVNASANLQVLVNPSGSLPSGSGLGEPKFQINVTAFKGPWGRPQRDGPALRAITLMSYSQYLIDHGNSSDVADRIWPIVRNDLNYVAQYWNNTGFDLWEEVDGSSFFTILNQHRALLQGSKFASTISQSCPACDSQAPQVLCFLQNFWNGTSVTANINTNTVRSGRDANTLLGAISTFDINGSCTDNTFQPCNSKMLATHKVLVDSFRNIYPINTNNSSPGHAVAIGRYPEDVYFGGNPWYLTTLSAAELLYDAIAQWNLQGSLTIDNTSLPFFTDLYPSATTQTYTNTSTDFTSIINATTSYADAFVSIIQSVTPTNGSLDEQFNRNTSAPLSAIDLTWSFASFVTMSQRRAAQFPASWGSTTSQIANTCLSGGAGNLTYTPAVTAGAPNITCVIPSSIGVLANTTIDESIFLVGNISEFGSWNPSQGWPMVASSGFSASFPAWNLSLPLYPDVAAEFKFVRYNRTGDVWTFENQLRFLNTPGCASGNTNATMVVVDAVWSGPE